MGHYAETWRHADDSHAKARAAVVDSLLFGNPKFQFHDVSDRVSSIPSHGDFGSLIKQIDSSRDTHCSATTCQSVPFDVVDRQRHVCGRFSGAVSRDASV